MKDITSFTGPYKFLSNFSPAPVKYKGVEFPTVEHAYQAAKSNDKLVWAEILALPSPGQAKRYSKKIKLHLGWEQNKVSIMEDLVRQKFQNGVLRDALKATGDATLIEGNHWGDVFWGECPLGTGLNHLGKILMKVRDENL